MRIPLNAITVCLMALAIGAPGQTSQDFLRTTLVSGHFDDAPLADALDELLAQNGISYSVDEGEISHYTVTAHLSDVPLGDALDSVLGLFGYTFHVGGGGIVTVGSTGRIGELRNAVMRRQQAVYIAAPAWDRQQLEAFAEAYLSDVGRIRARGRGLLEVYDRPEIIEEITDQLGQASRQMADAQDDVRSTLLALREQADAVELQRVRMMEALGEPGLDATGLREMREHVEQEAVGLREMIALLLLQIEEQGLLRSQESPHLAERQRALEEHRERLLEHRRQQRIEQQASDSQSTE